MVLRGRPQHGGAADVDLLDRLLPRDAGAGDGVLERVEVDADEVERRDAVPLEVGDVLGDIAAGEDASVNGRMQRHDPVAEHLGEPRQRLDARDVEPGVREETRRAAARQELDPEPVEPFGERGQASLVPRGEERRRCHEAMSSSTTSGSSRCSTSRIRACRVSAVSSGNTGTLLPEHRAGVDPLVDEVNGGTGLGDTGGERVLDGVDTGERGKQRRVHVDDAAGEALEEARRSRCM